MIRYILVHQQQHVCLWRYLVRVMRLGSLTETLFAVVYPLLRFLSNKSLHLCFIRSSGPPPPLTINKKLSLSHTPHIYPPGKFYRVAHHADTKRDS